MKYCHSKRLKPALTLGRNPVKIGRNPMRIRRLSAVLATSLAVCGLGLGLAACGSDGSTKTPTHAAVREYVNVPDVEAAAKEVEATFVPLLQEIPGFVGYYVIAPEGDDSPQLISVSLFTSADAAEASNKVALDWVADHPEVFPPASSRNAGRVVVAAAG
jgi:hypothetical protein